MTGRPALTCATPAREASIGDVIDVTADNIPANVLEMRGCTGEVWRRTTDDNRCDEDGADYDWTAGDWLATDGGVLSCGPLRVTKVA